MLAFWDKLASTVQQCFLLMRRRKLGRVIRGTAGSYMISDGREPTGAEPGAPKRQRKNESWPFIPGELHYCYICSYRKLGFGRSPGWGLLGRLQAFAHFAKGSAIKAPGRPTSVFRMSSKYLHFFILLSAMVSNSRLLLPHVNFFGDDSPKLAPQSRSLGNRDSSPALPPRPHLGRNGFLICRQDYLQQPKYCSRAKKKLLGSGFAAAVPMDQYHYIQSSVRHVPLRDAENAK